MCRWCDTDPSDSMLTPEQAAKQQRVIQLLTLVEHPDALPRRDALRLGQEILVLLDEIDDACDASPLGQTIARAGLPRSRDGRPPLMQFQ